MNCLIFLGSNWYGYNLLKSRTECRSPDSQLGNVDSPEECSIKCSQKAGCKYFAVKRSVFTGTRCIWEKTNNASCAHALDIYN